MKRDQARLACRRPVGLAATVLLGLVVSCCTAVVSRGAAEPDEPAGPAAEADGATGAEGPLEIVITAVQGKVQTRADEGKDWELVAVGMKLAEGSELRTLPKSRVQFMIPPDQTFVLDRASTL